MAPCIPASNLLEGVVQRTEKTSPTWEFLTTMTPCERYPSTIFDPISATDPPLFMCKGCLGLWGDANGLLEASMNIMKREQKKKPPLWTYPQCQGLWGQVSLGVSWPHPWPQGRPQGGRGAGCQFFLENPILLGETFTGGPLNNVVFFPCMGLFPFPLCLALFFYRSSHLSDSGPYGPCM